MRVVVTGSARGIGLALCQALTASGAEVIAACRTARPELVTTGATVVEHVDVAEDAGMGPLREAVGHEPVDVVICNAAINDSYPDGIEDVAPATVAHELQVNALGALRTVQAIRPNLQTGAKIVLLSSGIVAQGLPGKLTPAQYGYKMSKAALNEFGVALANELRPAGVSVLVLNPGPTDTTMLRRVFETGHTSFDPSQAASAQDVAADLLERIDGFTHEDSGAWLGRDGTRLEI